MNWIVITKADQVIGSRIRIFGPAKIHILKILKKSVSDSLRIVRPDITRGTYRIVNIEEDYVEVEEESILGKATKPYLNNIEVFFALPRPQTGKKILHLCGAYGIGKINFIFPEDKNKEYLTSPLYNGGELTELYGGMSQTGNLYSTEIIYTRSAKDFYQRLNHKDTYVMDPEGERLGSLFHSILTHDPPTAKFVFGPEAGFHPFEIAKFKDMGIKIFTLGEVVLRTEYAFHAFLHESQMALEANSARNK